MLVILNSTKNLLLTTFMICISHLACFHGTQFLLLYHGLLRICTNVKKVNYDVQSYPQIRCYPPEQYKSGLYYNTYLCLTFIFSV